MKKKIVLGISAFSVLFLFMGLYIVYTIHVGTARLNDLIRLHQVEILREQFLIQIKRVQSDLTLRHKKMTDEIQPGEFPNASVSIFPRERPIDYREYKPSTASAGTSLHPAKAGGTKRNARGSVRNM